MDTTKLAVLDESHRVFVNYESFFFADDAERKRFLDDPVTWCGWLTDPVTLLRFRPDKGARAVERAGRLFYFSSDSTRAAFAAQPDSFVIPRTAMMPMPAMMPGPMPGH